MPGDSFHQLQIYSENDNLYQLSTIMPKKYDYMTMFKKLDIDMYVCDDTFFCGKGFKEGKVACCGSGPYRGILSCGGKRGVTEYELCDNVTEYVFFDSGHSTERLYGQFAKQFWSGPANSTAPYNLKALFESKY